MFAHFAETRKGKPWEPFEEAKLWDDCKAGCTLLGMAMRLRRSEEEVEAKLLEMKLEVKPRRIPGGRWNR